MAHYEPAYQELHCLQIQLFSSMVLIEFDAVLSMMFSASSNQISNHFHYMYGTMTRETLKNTENPKQKY